MTDYAYYIRSARYGSPGLVGYELDGKPVHDRHGGIVVCPRCGSPLSVGYSQLNHGPVTPCSIAHTGHRLDYFRQGRNKAFCRAHWVMGDPEEAVAPGSVSPGIAEELSGFAQGTPSILRRPVQWHGDV